MGPRDQVVRDGSEPSPGEPPPPGCFATTADPPVISTNEPLITSNPGYHSGWKNGPDRTMVKSRTLFVRGTRRDPSTFGAWQTARGKSYR